MKDGVLPWLADGCLQNRERVPATGKGSESSFAMYTRRVLLVEPFAPESLKTLLCGHTNHSA